LRKSTIVAIALILFAAVSMLFLFDSYTKQIADEIRNAKELSDEFRPQLVEGTKVKLRRTPGADGYVVRDPESFGLLLEAHPLADVLKPDAGGFQLARQLAARAFELYGGDRPIQWIEVKLFRPDGTRIPSIGLQRGEGTSVVPVEPAGK